MKFASFKRQNVNYQIQATKFPILKIIDSQKAKVYIFKLIFIHIFFTNYTLPYLTLNTNYNIVYV